jgi:hypothetical protein
MHRNLEFRKKTNIEECVPNANPVASFGIGPNLEK